MEHIPDTWNSDTPLIPAHIKRVAKRWRKGLTLQQHVVMQKYIKQAYSNINAHLRLVDDPRYESMDAAARTQAETHHDILAEITPLVLREECVVYRGSWLPDHVTARGEWTDPAWVSTTFHADHARFAAASSPENRTGVLMQLHLLPGCAVIPISYVMQGHPEISNEHEMLLTPCHRFRVESIEEGTLRVKVWHAWELADKT